MISPEVTGVIQRALSSGSRAEAFQTVLNVVMRRFGAEMGMIHRLNAADGHLEQIGRASCRERV